MTPHRWMRRRGTVIAAYLGTLGVGAWSLTMPLAWGFEGWTGLEQSWGLGSIVCVLVFLGLHVLFLWPIRRPSVSDHRKPLWTSFIAAGAMIAALTTGVLISIAHVTADFNDWNTLPWTYVLIGLIAASWVLSTVLLAAFVKPGRPESVIRRLAARLFMGTIIEAAAIIPLDVLVRRKEDCVCATGTTFAFTLCGVVGFFLMGPVVFLPVISRRRRRWYAGRCEVCGYDMSRTMTVERCPECGAGWKGGK